MECSSSTYTISCKPENASGVVGSNPNWAGCEVWFSSNRKVSSSCMSRPSVSTGVKRPSWCSLNPCENSPASSSWTIYVPSKEVESSLSSFNIWQDSVIN